MGRKAKIEYIANGILIGVQQSRYGTCIYNTERNDFNHGHLLRAADKGYQAAVDRACEWLKNNVPNECDGTVWGNFIDEFKQYMED